MFMHTYINAYIPTYMHTDTYTRAHTYTRTKGKKTHICKLKHICSIAPISTHTRHPVPIAGKMTPTESA